MSLNTLFSIWIGAGLGIIITFFLLVYFDKLAILINKLSRRLLATDKQYDEFEENLKWSFLIGLTLFVIMGISFYILQRWGLL